jgi:hypothetical protein
MSRASRARRVVTAAAFGTGSLGALSAAVAGVIYGETKLARRRIQPAEADPPRADGIWLAPGAQADAPPLVLAMLGDSSAAGYGVHTDSETPAAQMAIGVSALARRPSRTLAAAQAVAVVAAGGRAVSLGDILGPEFASSLDYFSADQFHPSAIGYARAAEVLLPSAAAALGLSTVSEAAAPFTSTRARPVAQAAARSAGLPGTEVLPAQVHGQRSGRRGPWARLIRRRAATVIPPTSSGGENFTPATMVGSD